MFKRKKIKETRNLCNVRKLVNGSSSKVVIKYLPSHRKQREDKGLCTIRETKELNILSVVILHTPPHKQQQNIRTNKNQKLPTITEVGGCDYLLDDELTSKFYSISNVFFLNRVTP